MIEQLEMTMEDVKVLLSTNPLASEQLKVIVLQRQNTELRAENTALKARLEAPETPDVTTTASTAVVETA
jgi:regulator of replication initiation timing